MFKCDLCLKEFSTKPRLNRHVVNKVCVQSSHTCIDCNATYDKYKSYWMHLSRGCVMKKVKENLNKTEDKTEDKKYDIIIKELESVKNENRELVKMVKNENRELVKMVKNIENKVNNADIIKNKIENVNNNVNNIVNNKNVIDNSITNNNNIIDNSVNNNVIVLAKFGNEDMSKLSSAEIYQVLKEGAYATNKLVELLHFNENLPENHNILFKNINTRYGETFNGDKWMTDYKTSIINTLFDSKKLTNVTKKAIELVINPKDDSEILIYNNRDIIYNKNNNNLALKKLK